MHWSVKVKASVNWKGLLQKSCLFLADKNTDLHSFLTTRTFHNYGMVLYGGNIFQYPFTCSLEMFVSLSCWCKQLFLFLPCFMNLYLSILFSMSPSHPHFNDILIKSHPYLSTFPIIHCLIHQKISSTMHHWHLLSYCSGVWI